MGPLVMTAAKARDRESISLDSEGRLPSQTQNLTKENFSQLLEIEKSLSISELTSLNSNDGSLSRSFHADVHQMLSVLLTIVLLY
ncbi:hypothetical protein TNCV_1364811 [Trichonephila clavipes]|nr:hypothetical protein TNCV_1364811 [Trichonephila clavipes]